MLKYKRKYHKEFYSNIYVNKMMTTPISGICIVKEHIYIYREFKVSEVKLNFLKEQRYFEIYNLLQKINKINK